MQEEVENRTVTLTISGAKLTGRTLMFLDQREEERLQEEGRLAFGEDDGWMDCWGGLWSNEDLVDEMDRLSDLCNDIEYALD